MLSKGPMREEMRSTEIGSEFFDSSFIWRKIPKKSQKKVIHKLHDNTYADNFEIWTFYASGPVNMNKRRSSTSREHELSFALFSALIR